MTKRSPLAASSLSHTLRMRFGAIVALVLMLAASWAQAVHTHGDWLPHPQTQAAAAPTESGLAADEAGCPLCVAMHSARAADRAELAAHFAVFRYCVAAAQNRQEAADWPAILFGRPPPRQA